MATVGDRLTALEQAMQDVRRRLGNEVQPRAWLDELSGSLEPWPEFAEVLKLGREYRDSVVD
jgi:hypothetical protein